MATFSSKIPVKNEKNLNQLNANDKNSVSVIFYSTHLNHNDSVLKLSNLEFTNEEESFIKSKLEDGIATSKVIDLCKNKFKESIKIRNLIYQDIANIKNKFSIKQEFKLHANDSESVRLLIENKQDYELIILGHKPQFKDDNEFKMFKKDDFFSLFYKSIKRNSL